jgi:hypothetical protein
VRPPGAPPKSHTSAHHTRDFSSYACSVSVMERISTDKRLDDFPDRLGRFEDNVDRRFDKVDGRFDRFEADVDRSFDKVDERFEKMVTKEEFEKATSGTKEQFTKVEGSIAALGQKVDTTNRTLVGGIIVAVAIRFLFG